MASTLSLGRRFLAMITPQVASSIDIVLDSGSALLLGATADASPALLRGRVVLELAEPMRIQEVSVRFRGRASVPAVSESLGDADPSEYTVCSENWLLFESAFTDDILPAGTHTYPFKTFIGGSLPASTTESSPHGISVVYSLRATAMRANRRPNLRRTITVPVLRSFPSDSLEFFQSLDHEHTIPGELSYSLSLPHKAWAAGDTLTAIFHASMHTKEVSIRAVKTCITQTRRVLKHGDWERQVETIASSSHYVHHAPEGARMLKSILGVHHSKPARRVAFAEDEESHPSGSTFSPITQHSDRDISVILDLPIPASTSPSHSVAPIYVDHHVCWTLTIVDASGAVRDHHCRLPLHILDHRLLLETVAATLASRLQALNGSPTSSSDSTELPEIHTPPSYQAHVQDRVPELYVLPEVAERSSSLLNIIPPPRSADFSLTPPHSSTPSYEDAAKGFLGGLPPLELLRQLPSYAA
ncbi:hypothetical protein PENSPDRAFT_656117 [Peniophora sp. CONT]|nr:hypothetical protein PENSPDRAFT_656117 [Peniophora sp. CONT]